MTAQKRMPRVFVGFHSTKDHLVVNGDESKTLGRKEIADWLKANL